MDRREFLQLTAGTGTSLWAAASLGVVGDECDLLESAHFQSDHVVVANQMTAPGPAVVETIRRRVEADKLSWSRATSTSLQMPNAKLKLLITIMRHITDRIQRQDLFADWTFRLVWREEFAGSACGGVGLAHDFQGRQEVATLNREVDWWAFLIPDGLGFDASDEEPIHLVVVPVFGQTGMQRTIESWSATARLARYVCPRRLARNSPAEAAGQLNRALSQSLHEIGNPASSHVNGRHS